MPSGVVTGWCSRAVQTCCRSTTQTSAAPTRFPVRHGGWLAAGHRTHRPLGVLNLADYAERVVRRAGATPPALRAAVADRVDAFAVAAPVVLRGVAAAVAFFAVVALGFVSFGAGATPSTTSLNPFNGVILATVLAFTLTASPVAGLRAIRAGRFTFENLAKPVKATSSPFATVAKITSSVPSITLAATLGSTSVWQQQLGRDHAFSSIDPP